MVKQYQNGFTLVEIILVIGIAAGLLLIVFAGQAQVRNRSRFTDGIERVTTMIANIKNEALSTVPPQGAGTYSNVFYSKFVMFTPNSGDMQVKTLTTCPVGSPTSIGGGYCRYDDYTATLPYGITVDGSSPLSRPAACAMFTKGEQTAQPGGLAYDNCQADFLSDAAKIPGSVVIPFRDATGQYHANVTFTASDLSVKVTYLD